MIISIEKLNDVTVVAPDGRLDAVGAPEMETAGKKLVQEGAKRLVLDLAKVVYISSAGLRCLLVLVKTVKAAGGAVVLCNLAPSVREVMALSGFDAILSLAADRSAAVGMFK